MKIYFFNFPLDFANIFLIFFFRYYMLLTPKSIKLDELEDTAWNYNIPIYEILF